MKSKAATHLGTFLKEARERLDPQALGYSMTRRRTPGLRREEIAQRANISVTWYTWLEQGRGGTPSAEVLNRIAKALELSTQQTEYLFLTTLGRSPQIQYQLKEEVTPRLQHILDGLNPNIALIRNLTWDVLAWNRAAAMILTDYSLLPERERNVMRLFFMSPETRRHNLEWQNNAQLLISSFRADIARIGDNAKTTELINELYANSEVFAYYWDNHEISDNQIDIKRLQKPGADEFRLAYSSFNVSDSPELNLMVFTPVDEHDKEVIEQLMSL